MTTCELQPRERTSRELNSRELAPRELSPGQHEPALDSPLPHRRLRQHRLPRHRLRRHRLVALAVGLFLLPWSVVLGLTLPASTFVPDWSLAWMGLDLAEAAAALLTAMLLRRGSPRAGLPAMAGAGVLFADAWFDVCTSPAGPARWLAVGEAALLELPLAAAAIWLAVTLTKSLTKA